ncbi:MAG TPA: ATP-grasp domain-containing protein [Gammaproteobacteria bacterium]|nr:ATP-grasp domain-containing protein [Gammaproteobacteria bacterium]
MIRNIFFIGLNQLNRQRLHNIRDAESYCFHGLLDPAAVLETEHFPMEKLIETARAQLKAFEGPIDAIVAYMDFPVSTMWPILCREFGTPSPSLESLLKCEHKYWSRLEQKQVVAEHIPDFFAFDPFEASPLARIPFNFPFWLKPIKSSGSRLGFRINNKTDFDEALRILRENIGLISEPFNYVLNQAELPPDIAKVEGHYCLAEQIIEGRQCTLEGYVFQGQPRIYGVVDSIRHRNHVSFLRYQYPSRLPVEVRRRMVRLAKRVIKHVGFDNSAFNMEFYWNQKNDHIWLLEINTRLSESHCDLFEKVDGRSNQEIAVDIALGRKPDFPRRQGRFKVAAKFFHRRFEDAEVVRVPSATEIAALEARYPGLIIAPQVQPEMRLSDLPEQDSYSFAVAHIFLGAPSQKQLLRDYRRIRRALGFEYRPIASRQAETSFLRTG